MGLRFGYRLDLRDPSRVLEYAVGADRAGFEFAWVPDHLTAGSPTQVCFDAWTFLAAAGVKTERIRLGPSVSDIVRRDPVTLAQSAATLRLITGGRCVLGLGLGEAMNLLPFGMEPSSQTARMKEAVELIRLLWRSSFDKRVSYKGRFYGFEGAWLQFPDPGPVPIYIGALGPKTQTLAGEVADGWFPAIHSKAVFTEAVKNIREGLLRARRRAEEIDVVARFYLAITEDVNDGLRKVGPAARNMLLTEQKSLEGMGILTEEMRAFSGHSMVPEGGEWTKRQQAALAKIPDAAVKETTLVGTPAQIADRISEFQKLGATQIVIQDPTDGVIQTQREFMAKVAPLLS